MNPFSIERFLSSIVVSERTRKNYGFTLNLLERELGALETITGDRFVSWHLRTRRSPRTGQTYIATLRTWRVWAERRGLPPLAEGDTLRRELHPGRKEPDAEPLPSDHVRVILRTVDTAAAADDPDQRIELAFQRYIHTLSGFGLRASEPHGLSWHHVSSLLVRRMSDVRARGIIHVPRAKRGARVVRVGEMLREGVPSTIEAVRLLRRHNRTIHPAPADPLIRRQNWEHWRRRCWERLLTMCPLGVRYQLRQLRPTFAQLCAELGIPPTLIADWLGHRDLTSLPHYITTKRRT